MSSLKKYLKVNEEFELTLFEQEISELSRKDLIDLCLNLKTKLYESKNFYKYLIKELYISHFEQITKK